MVTMDHARTRPSRARPSDMFWARWEEQERERYEAHFFGLRRVCGRSAGGPPGSSRTPGRCCTRRRKPAQGADRSSRACGNVLVVDRSPGLVSSAAARGGGGRTRPRESGRLPDVDSRSVPQAAVA